MEKKFVPRITSCMVCGFKYGLANHQLSVSCEKCHYKRSRNGMIYRLKTHALFPKYGGVIREVHPDYFVTEGLMKMRGRT